MRAAVRWDKASVTAFIPQARPTVYRVYDAEGGLLYAGASILPRERLQAHLRNGLPGAWVEVEFYRTTTAMARSERAAIGEGTVLDSGVARRHKTWKAQRREV